MEVLVGYPSDAPSGSRRSHLWMPDIRTRSLRKGTQRCYVGPAARSAKGSFLISWDWVRLSPLGTSATVWPIVPAPDER
jgi:hypothetical protein